MGGFVETYTVSFFGHRELQDFLGAERKLVRLVEEVLEMGYYVCFFVGRNGEFDELVASVIKRIGKVRGKESHSLVLILPYPISHMEDYEEYYDDIIIPETVEKTHYKAAISLRNRWMIKKSDCVVVNVRKSTGGAYAAMKYARECGKKVIDLAKDLTDF